VVDQVFYPEFMSPQRVIGQRNFDFSRQVAVMAIINRTPDSFHDRGRTFAWPKAVEAVERAISDGADWIDIGAVPFRPDVPEVSEREELDRLLPLIEATRERTDAVISAETWRIEVARQALAAGADVINNTTALHDPALADVVAVAGAHLIITHSLAPPRTLLPRPHYEDIAAEVAALLRERAELATSRGRTGLSDHYRPWPRSQQEHLSFSGTDATLDRDYGDRVSGSRCDLQQGLYRGRVLTGRKTTGWQRPWQRSRCVFCKVLESSVSMMCVRLSLLLEWSRLFSAGVPL
jgi:hypothetical protein